MVPFVFHVESIATRILRNLFLGLAAVVSGLLGCVVLGWTMESKAVAEKTQPQPVKLSLLQLRQGGVPDNLYVGFSGKLVTEYIRLAENAPRLWK